MRDIVGSTCPGTTIWRVLIPVTSVAHIPELTVSTSWWHGPSGHVYHSFVDDPEEVPYEERMYEIAARTVVDPETATGKRFSWGIPATNERVESQFVVSHALTPPRTRDKSTHMSPQEYDPRIRELLSKVPEGQWKEFSAFAGPRLEKLTGWDKVVLLGDASHPLSGECPIKQM